mgnify:CR=1 FL=1
MKKNLAKKITMSILAGAMLMSSSVVWAGSDIVNSASGSGAIAIGGGAGASPTANGSNAVAIGNNTQANGLNAVAIGNAAKAGTNNSVAMGYEAEANESNAVAIGLQAKANGSASVAIGDGAIADAVNVVSVGNGGASGAGGPAYRKIINVNDGTDEHDAVTLGQLQNNYYNINQIDEKFRTLGGASSGTGSVDLSDYAKTADVNAALGDKDFTGTNYIDSATDLTDATKKLDTQVKANADALETKANKADVYTKDEVYNKTEIDSMIHTSANVDGINRKLEKLGTRLEKVGAGAAALAALHPLDYDPDDKLTFSAGMGNYAGENAAALGAFYRPNEKFMLSLGGTMGNGENMVNLGLSIGLDKASGLAKLSKRELIQKVNAVEAENEAIKADNEAMKDQLANADERIAKLEALVAQLVAK